MFRRQSTFCANIGQEHRLHTDLFLIVLFREPNLSQILAVARGRSGSEPLERKFPSARPTPNTENFLCRPPVGDGQPSSTPQASRGSSGNVFRDRGVLDAEGRDKGDSCGC